MKKIIIEEESVDFTGFLFKKKHNIFGFEKYYKNVMLLKMLWRGTRAMNPEFNKNVKKVLIQYKKVKWMIDDIDAQIRNLDSRMISIKAGKITGMPRGGTPITVADLLGDKDDLITRKLRFEKIANQKKEIVQSYIDTVLSVKHNRFLTLYFIKCKSIEEISEQEHYSDRHAFRVYREALNMVDLSLDL